MDNTNIKLYVTEYSNDLTPTDKLIKMYFLEHWDETFVGTEIANQLNISQASISKFIKKLSFKSIRELNKLKNCNENDLLNYVITNKLEHLTNTLKMNSQTNFEKVVSEIKQHHTIFVYGIGHSYLCANNFYQRFNKIGIRVVLLRERNDIITHLHSITSPDSLIIIFSESGKTKEIIHFSKFCLDNDKKYVLFTSNPISFVAKNSLINLVYSRNNINYLLETIGPEEPVIFLIDIIYMKIINDNYNSSLLHYNNSDNYTKFS